jgi:hypothetical protein
MDGLHWLVQNVSSGRYLGVPLDANVHNSLRLKEVDHKIGWRIKIDKDCQESFQYVLTNHSPYMSVMNALKALRPLYDARSQRISGYGARN